MPGICVIRRIDSMTNSDILQKLWSHCDDRQGSQFKVVIQCSMMERGTRPGPSWDQVGTRPELPHELVAMTVPDKPSSSKQRYRLTEAGRALLAGPGAEDHRA